MNLARRFLFHCLACAPLAGFAATRASAHPMAATSNRGAVGGATTAFMRVPFVGPQSAERSSMLPIVHCAPALRKLAGGCPPRRGPL